MKISVIIPAYNVEHYIKECITSIFSKISSDYEIVVINDGSTDDTARVLAEISKINPHVKYFSTENQGQSAARNYGVKKSSGDFIIFLDADDKFALGALDHLFNIIEKYKCVSIFFFNGESFYEDESLDGYSFNYIRNNAFYNKVLNLQKFSYDTILSGDFIASPVLYLFKKELFYGNEFYPNIIHEDNLFTAKLMLSNNVSCLIVPEVIYLRRIRYGSVMTSTVKRKNIIGYVTCARELTFLKADLPKSLHPAVNKLFTSWILEAWRLEKKFNLGCQLLIKNAVRESIVRSRYKFILTNAFIIFLLIKLKLIIKAVKRKLK